MPEELERYLHRLYQDYAPTLWKRACRLTGDAKEAEDLVQEVFLIAAKKAEQLSVHPNPAAWLHKTLSNLLYRELRKSAVREVPIGDDIELFSSAEAEENISFHFPAQLPAADQELLRLRYEQKMTYQELSDRFGISLSAVKMRLQRAKARCREELVKNDSCPVTKEPSRGI